MALQLGRAQIWIEPDYKFVLTSWIGESAKWATDRMQAGRPGDEADEIEQPDLCKS